MKVSGILKGKPVLAWKSFTIRGEAKYDNKSRGWTYQLNKDGKEYAGNQYFPESKLKKEEPSET